MNKSTNKKPNVRRTKKRSVNSAGPSSTNRPETLASVNKVYQNTYRRSFMWSTFVSALTTDRIEDGRVTLEDCFPAGDVASYKTIFDEYRITEFSVRYEPSILTPVSIGTTAVVIPPNILSFIDFDGFDVTTITRQQIEEYACVKSHKPGTVASRKIVPMFLVLSQTGSSNVPNKLSTGWLDIGSSAIPHRGIGFYVPAAANASLAQPVSIGRFVFNATVHFRGGR